MGWRIFFYLSRLFGKTLVAVTLFFGVFLFWIEFFEFQRQGWAPEATSFFQKVVFLGLKIPFTLQQLLPFLIFLTSLALFWRLNRGNEIIILRSFGASIWRVTAPFFMMASLFGLLNLFAFQPASLFLFHLHKKQERLHSKAHVPETLTPSQMPDSSLWYKQKVGDTHFIYRLTYEPGSTQATGGVSVFVFDTSYRFLTSYEAERGQVHQGRLLLKNVWKASGQTGTSYHQSVEVPFILTSEDFFQKIPSPQDLSFGELTSWIRWMDRLGMSSYLYRLERQRLLSLTAWFAGMVLLASAFGANVRRPGGGMWLMGLGVSGSLCLYFLRDLTHALAGARFLPLGFAAWSVCLITFLAALVSLVFQEEALRK